MTNGRTEEVKYSKTCVKRPLKNSKTKIFMTNGSLMKVKSIADSRILQSKKEGKDQESIQPSTTPVPVYQLKSDHFTIRHHKREPRDQFGLH